MKVNENEVTQQVFVDSRVSSIPWLAMKDREEKNKANRQYWTSFQLEGISNLEALLKDALSSPFYINLNKSSIGLKLVYPVKMKNEDIFNYCMIHIRPYLKVIKDTNTGRIYTFIPPDHE
jgi:hypothetical protein